MRLDIPMAIAAAALAAACTPMQWVKQDATPQQLREDSIQCQQEAWLEARMRTWYYQPLAPMFIRDSLGNRILAWPYGSYDPLADPYMEEARLTQFCMRNKGYALVPVEPAK